MKKRRGIKFPSTKLGSAVLGISLSALVLIIVSLLFSAVLSMTENPIGSIGLSSLAALLISGVLSGIIISRRMGEGGFPSSVVTSLIFTLIMLAAALIASGGKLSGGMLMNSGCYLGVAAVAAFLGRKRDRRRRR